MFSSLRLRPYLCRIFFYHDHLLNKAPALLSCLFARDSHILLPNFLFPFFLTISISHGPARKLVFMSSCFPSGSPEKKSRVHYSERSEVCRCSGLFSYFLNTILLPFSVPRLRSLANICFFSVSSSSRFAGVCIISFQCLTIVSFQPASAHLCCLPPNFPFHDFSCVFKRT